MAKYSLVRVDEFCDGGLQAIDKSMIWKKIKDLSRRELICCVFGVLGPLVLSRLSCHSPYFASFRLCLESFAGFRCLSGTRMLSRLVRLICTKNNNGNEGSDPPARDRSIPGGDRSIQVVC
ncbi:hypothetical protein AtEden1_Chr1g0042501 [Arabidopsis thaliana]